MKALDKACEWSGMGISAEKGKIQAVDEQGPKHQLILL